MDVRDLGIRVLAKLQSTDFEKTDYSAETVLVGVTLTATDLASVPVEKLKGVISLSGSANSHIAILAEAMGIPAVMGIENFPAEWMDGKPVIVDGFGGSVIATPSKEILAYYEDIVK